jgi:hypothetical protein
MGLRALVLAVLVAALAVFAPVAWGAFPGRDGDLVVATGGGLELVSPVTGAAQPICTQEALCGQPTQPNVSPNGQAIAFLDATSGRLVVVSADGSCLWCLLGPHLTSVVGGRPAFMPGGQRVSVIGNGVGAISLTGAHASRLLSAPVQAAAWSSTGLVAVVRAGSVWVGRPGHGTLHRLLRGNAPSWSPDGTRLAFARAGYIWTARVAGGRERRLAAGTAPAFSPDGRQVAFIAPGGAVAVIAAGGGHARQVGSVQGTALDWQPIPSPAKPMCKPPAHAHVLASNSEAVVFSAGVDFYGCLKVLGRTRRLPDASALEGDSGIRVLTARLAGRFAVLELETATDTTSYEAAMLFDLGGGETTDLADLSWDWNAGPITYGLDSVALDSSGFAAWRITGGPMPGAANYPMPLPIDALSCPSVSLCLAGDAAGNILSSTNPAGGSTAWSIAPVLPAQGISGLSCPSISLCVAVGRGAGGVLTSTTPAGGAPGWTSATPDQRSNFDAISCPSVSLCVALGNQASGRGATVLTSTDPTGGAGSWISAPLARSDLYVGAVSCPSVSLCVATTNNGDVLVSHDPTGGAGAWTNATIDPGGWLTEISCPSESLCVAGGQTGHVFTSTDPTAGNSAWTKIALSPGTNAVTAVSCPSVSLCLAGDGNGNIFSTTDPTGGASAWTKATLTPGSAVTHISCPSVSQCVATGSSETGNIFTSTDPTGGASAWTSSSVDIPGCPQTPTSCTSEQLFTHDDQGSRVIDTTPPGDGSSIANVTFASDSLTLNWTHNAAQQQLQLR